MMADYRRRRRILFWTVFPWTVLVFLHFGAWINAAMAGPLSAEFKEDRFDFQIIVYLF